MSVNNPEGTLGEKLDTTKMPGHWLLARLGKRVLRPGGRELIPFLRDYISLAAFMKCENVVSFAIAV